MSDAIEYIKEIKKIITGKNENKILNLLKEEGELSVSEIRERLPELSNPSIELTSLRSLNLVKWRRKKGSNHKLVYYQINKGKFKQISDTFTKVNEHVTNKLKPLFKD